MSSATIEELVQQRQLVAQLKKQLQHEEARLASLESKLRDKAKIQDKEGTDTATDDRVVYRFWKHDERVPALDAAVSWARRGFHQIIYTNLLEPSMWSDLDSFELHPLPEHLVDPDLCVEYQKDEWQFGIVKGAPHAVVLCVDWDFYIVKDLPDTSTILISEWTKATGGQVPKNTLRPGSSTRLHLGITKFEADDPIADEIYNMFVDTRKACKNITKMSAKWMKHTEQAQAIVLKHDELSIFEPIYFNPYPIWMKKPHYDKRHYGVQLPALSEVTQMTVAFTTWEGHSFCKETLYVLKQLAIGPIDPSIEVSDDVSALARPAVSA